MRTSQSFAALLVAILFGARADAAALVSASSSAPECPPHGAVDGERFALGSGHLWKGEEGRGPWWWQIRFPKTRDVGAILQILGDHEFVLRSAHRDSIWQWSTDGDVWKPLPETEVRIERRLVRLHRLKSVVRAQFLRLKIAGVEGSAPVLREVEFFPRSDSTVPFPEWIVAVNTTHDPALPGHGREFIPLAKASKGFEQLEAQQIWLPSLDEPFLRVEPRPLAVFLSGNFKDWCEVRRADWRGLEEVLRAGRVPIWGSCGGAQGLAILWERGAEKPWDCPHCRDPKDPKLPIYGHIGHTAAKPCGDYSGCIFERGPHKILKSRDDPAFEGLSREFSAVESHCGQIEHTPEGWLLVATAGEGTKTIAQCIRRVDRPIYAAQFHIEMQGTPESSTRIMANFLKLARAWGGYRIEEKLPFLPEPLRP